jgi:hypothetical protein
LALSPIRKVIPSHSQIRELGFATKDRHSDGRQHRILCTRLLERTVAVPQLICDVADYFGVRPICHLAIHLDVGDVGQFSVL